MHQSTAFRGKHFSFKLPANPSMSTLTHRQYSVTGRTCCICDRPCAILDCQCLENFQHNSCEHGSLMKRLTAAFSMLISAKDLHSFSLCCSCEHHLVVIEQANRIKECIKQVFLETREHRRFVNSQILKHDKLTPASITRQKRLSSAFDSRSFDDSSPRVKKVRIGSSSSFPPASLASALTSLRSPLPPAKSTPSSAASSSAFAFDEPRRLQKSSKVDLALSFDSAVLPGMSSSMAAPPDKLNSLNADTERPALDNVNNMEYEEPCTSTTPARVNR
ncbi:uncharacterized protein [Watersipora subatra]|uniref:uncharacterized protein n=1 Tax=Watersipora subatra TaxID=2589382 RepID=UPI00355B5A58